jgi:AcrR family transcriptional regulator
MADGKGPNASREAFVAAALRLCREGGPEHVSARRLGREMGVSQMALYRHFRDMEDLLATAWDRAFEFLLDAVRREAAGEDPYTSLRNGLLAYVRFGIENPGLYRLMFFHRFRDPRVLEDRTASLAALNLLKETIGACMAERGRNVPADQIHLHALQAWLTIHGLTTLAISGRFHRVAHPDPYRLAEHLVERMCESFFRMEESTGMMAASSEDPAGEDRGGDGGEHSPTG